MTEPTREDDEQVLTLLDLKFNEGLKHKALMERTGMSRGTISGILRRYNLDETPCVCRKKRNKDGGMPRFWWR